MRLIYSPLFVTDCPSVTFNYAMYLDATLQNVDGPEWRRSGAQTDFV